MTSTDQRRQGLGGLADLRFEVLVAPKALGLLYGLAWLVLLALAGSMVFLGAQAVADHEPFATAFVLGVAAIVLAPLVFLVGLLLVRIVLEVVLLLVQIEANTRLFRLRPSRIK